MIAFVRGVCREASEPCGEGVVKRELQPFAG